MVSALTGGRRNTLRRSIASALMALLSIGLFAIAASAAERDAALFSEFAPEIIVATIDGEPLTLGSLMIRFATLPQHVRDRYAARREGLQGFLAETVAGVVVAREADGRGVSEDPLFAVLMEMQREEILRDLYARRQVLAGIDQATLRARYLEQRELAFQREPLVRVRHILVTPVKESSALEANGDDALDPASARAKIERIHRDLTEGEGDFAEIARRLSEDASAAEGGDIGWKARGDLVPPLSKVAFSLAVGETSGVIESELGFHIAQVTERRRGGLVPFELVEELIFQELVGERAVYFARQAREDRDRLVEEHQVELFPERLPW